MVESGSVGLTDGFNTQPPEGGWECSNLKHHSTSGFQHTAARRRLEPVHRRILLGLKVSTHSRPKAAGQRRNAGAIQGQFQHTAARRRLEQIQHGEAPDSMFQHTAARRRLAALSAPAMAETNVSTHSRPKAAGRGLFPGFMKIGVSTHSRPKAAGLGF